MTNKTTASPEFGHDLKPEEKARKKIDELLANAGWHICAHNKVEEYETYFEKWIDEELANLANTLCHMVDKMMATHLAKKAEDFKENGGIRERMTAVRLGRRQTQNEEIAALKAEVERLRRENESLKRELAARSGGVGESRESRASRTSRESSISRESRVSSQPQNEGS